MTQAIGALLDGLDEEGVLMRKSDFAASMADVSNRIFLERAGEGSPGNVWKMNRLLCDRAAVDASGTSHGKRKYTNPNAQQRPCVHSSPLPWLGEEQGAFLNQSAV